jgi:catechol 2,3-dioxygenase-like lactoylglutathione lyase family enzyme
MINHLGLVVANFSRSMALYDACLAPLGIYRTETDLDWAIYALRDAGSFLWIGAEIPRFWAPECRPGASPLHIAFNARDRAAVNAFYAAALENGAQDNGPPGPRISWANFYSAFVLDLDGNNIEATLREA